MRSVLADLFYGHAEKTPDKQAVVCDGRSLSYREMADFVSRYENLLTSCGVAPGDHVAVPMTNSVGSIALIFAAADLGVCLVPINPTLPPEAVKTAMTFGDMKHLIARRAFFAECDKNGGVEVPGVSVCLDGEYAGAVPFSKIDDMPAERCPNEHLTGDESLILTLTSGSTGNPKPIDISQKNKYDRAMAHVRAYGITPDDRVLAATPLYHSLAERLVILPLILGATSILLPRFTPALWLNCVAATQPTFTIAVSAQLAQISEMMKQANAPAIDSFRCIVSSSALLEERVKKELIGQLRCEFHEMYGTSETSTLTDICFGEAPDKQKSVGLPFGGAEIRVLRDDNNTDYDTDCAPYEVGEIAAKTPLLCKGYYRQEAMMEASLFEGYFRTGDLGYLDEDGYLYFSGRKKELIITGAVNVYPHDIDTVVEALPEVAECAAFAYPDDRLGEVVALAVVPREGCSVEPRAIMIHCARHLADFQQPHKIFVVDHLPKNTLGKLQRTRILHEVADIETKR